MGSIFFDPFRSGPEKPPARCDPWKKATKKPLRESFLKKSQLFDPLEVWTCVDNSSLPGTPNNHL